MKTFRFYLKNNLIFDMQAENHSELMKNLDGDHLNMILQGLILHVRDMESGQYYSFVSDDTAAICN